MKRFEFCRLSAGLFVAMCVASTATLMGAEAPKKLGKKASEAEQLFTGDEVPKIQIEIATSVTPLARAASISALL